MLRFTGPATKPALTERVGAGRTLVTQKINEMIDVGLLVEDRIGKSTGGRIPREVRFRSEAAAVVGIEVGSSGIDVGITDLAGHPAVTHHEAWDVAQGPEATLDKLQQIVNVLRTDPRAPDAPLVAVGAGLASPVEFSSGRPVSPPYMPGWDDYPVRDQLADRFGVEAWVDNDVSAMALGELRAGLARDASDFMFVKLGWGVGAGLVSRGGLHRGADGCAGDIAHIVVPAKSPALCRCGRRGCLAAHASGAALAREAQRLADTGESPYLASLAAEGTVLEAAHVTAAARAGDPAATELLVQTGRFIGTALGTYVSFFNPSLVAIGGGVSKAGDVLLAAIRQAVYEFSLPLATRHLQIVPAGLGETAGIVGAAFTALDAVLRADRLAWWAEQPLKD
ncbi:MULTISPECIES: ROK family protein [Streptomyces]|uniref:ROK family protein n=1 Tax=Streptomyces cylindrosporus TaxID=2927583 RepID=A0ABS9Y0M9_9ACTN|nr:ROK family protein [Streptomyces cylindrosporus]MCI3270757.1 ROK family protein [Streptomyces cylindrosporus]